MSLSHLGWTPSLELQFQEIPESGLLPARVAREDRDRYLVFGEFGEAPAQVTGRFRRRAADRTDFPAVGDWVAVEMPDPGGPARIVRVLPRRSRFVRSAPGDNSKEQVVAANVNVVFLVSGLDSNFRLRRIERYLTLARESGAEPVVVLNKADLAEDADLRVRQAEGVAPDTAVLSVSATGGAGMEFIESFLGPGLTGAFLGSSGVGKSTLVNRLLGESRLAVGEVRAADERGRHTTSHRELIPLPGNRGLVIDTPGMRELQLRGGVEALGASFAEIEELAVDCRFRDCRHEGEPGCAVQAALGEDAVDPDRYEAWLEQKRELAWQERRTDERLRRAEEDKWRQIKLSYRKMKKHRDRPR